MPVKEVLLTLLMLSSLISESYSAPANREQDKQDQIKNLSLKQYEDQVYLAWDLLHPSDNVSRYKIDFVVGTSENQKWNKTLHSFENRLLVDFTSSLNCFDELNITVKPCNAEECFIGHGSRNYIWQDIFIDVKLQNKKGKPDVTLATWEIKCRREIFQEFHLTCREDYSPSAQSYSAKDYATRDETEFDAVCSTDNSRQCNSYLVNITSSEKDVIPFSGHYSTFKLTYHELQPTSVKLAWTKLNSMCNVTDYTIQYNEIKMWRHQTNGSIYLKVLGAEEKTLENLAPFADYTACVIPKRINVPNKLQSCVTFRTVESKPSEPLSVSIDASDTSSLNVTWQKPLKMNGNLLNYSIEWGKDGIITKSALTKDKFYKIIVEDPCIKYIIVVRAINGYGKGDAAWKTTETVKECNKLVTAVTPSSPANTLTADVTTEKPDPQCEGSSHFVLMIVVACVIYIIGITLVILFQVFGPRPMKECCSKPRKTDADQNGRRPESIPLRPE